MFEAMKSFVPSEVCLKCDGCCRFKEEKSVWQPKIAHEEEAAARNAGLAEQIFAQDVIASDRCIKTRQGDGIHLCSFLEHATNKCRIYSSRPFECQLYPFLLSKEAGTVSVYAHLNCPYVQQNQGTPLLAGYVDYLRRFFQTEEVKRFLRQNKTLINDYSRYKSEMEFLFNLEE